MPRHLSWVLPLRWPLPLSEVFDPSGPRVGRKEVTLGTWEPEERKY